jgi:class 3 adenylate cyclase
LLEVKRLALAPSPFVDKRFCDGDLARSAKDLSYLFPFLPYRTKRLHLSAGFSSSRSTGGGTIGFEGRFEYAAIGTVSNVAARLCDEAKSVQILVSPRVLMKVENAVTVEPVGEFELKGIRRPLAAYNVLATVSE